MEVNIIIGPILPRDKFLMFGPYDEYDKWVRTNETRLPQLMREAGVYKSALEALRAGFSGEVPMGFSHYTKKQKRVAIYRSPYTRWQCFLLWATLGRYKVMLTNLGN